MEVESQDLDIFHLMLPYRSSICSTGKFVRLPTIPLTVLRIVLRRVKVEVGLYRHLEVMQVFSKETKCFKSKREISIQQRK